MRRRRSFVGQEWASRDFNLIMAFMALLIAGRLLSLVFLYASLIVLLALLVTWTVRLLRRRHRYRTTPPSEFWPDRIKDS